MNLRPIFSNMAPARPRCPFVRVLVIRVGGSISATARLSLPWPLVSSRCDVATGE